MQRYRPLKKSKQSRSKLKRYLARTEIEMDVPAWVKAKRAEQKKERLAREERQLEAVKFDNLKALSNRL